MTETAEKKAISAEDFEKYGCPECGSGNYSEGPGAVNAKEYTCNSCQAIFIVLDQGTTVSPIAYGWEGRSPKLQPHPLAPPT